MSRMLISESSALAPGVFTNSFLRRDTTWLFFAPARSTALWLSVRVCIFPKTGTVTSMASDSSPAENTAFMERQFPAAGTLNTAALTPRAGTVSGTDLTLTGFALVSSTGYTYRVSVPETGLSLLLETDTEGFKMSPSYR